MLQSLSVMLRRADLAFVKSFLAFGSTFCLKVWFFPLKRTFAHGLGAMANDSGNLLDSSKY